MDRKPAFFAPPTEKPIDDLATQKLSSDAKSPAKTRLVELDMGEASREEGFRLNGCR